MSSVLKVDTIQNTGGNNLITTDGNTTSLKNPNGTTGLTINSDGVVTRPVIPAWRVGRGSDFNITNGQAATTVINYNLTDDTNRNCFIQGGCTISSGVVTVPVTGLYCVATSNRFDNIGGGYIVVRIVKNNETDSSRGTYDIIGQPSTNYFTVGDTTIFPLAANDTMKVDYYVSTDTNFTLNLRSYFSGYLIE